MIRIKKSKILRNLFKNKDLIRIVGAHDGLTAKLVEKHGFDGVWASGLEISTSHAVPDANILTMSDFLRAAITMNDAVKISVVMDCDTGFGNTNNVIRLVKKCEAADIAGICIEDKKFPKVNSLLVGGRQEMAPIAEFVGKIMAAKNAQTTDDFMVFARVEALIAGWGLKEALKRANAYADAGADGIFIHSKSKDPSSIIDFIKKFEKDVPIIICPTTYPSITEKEMKGLGIKMVIYANQGIRASIKAMNEVLSQIKDNGIVELDDKIASLNEVFEIQDMHVMKEQEKKFLKSDYGDVKVIIPAAGVSANPSLKELLMDRPITMLDINGKPILQRNVEVLGTMGINDISVVTGYMKEKIIMEDALKDLNIIKNENFMNKGLLHSIMLGLNNVGDKNLLIFSDILFNRGLIENLLKKDDDIVLVVDNSFKVMKTRDKKYDLVIIDKPTELRSFEMDLKTPIVKIGKLIEENDADSEFIGIVVLSKKGSEIFKKEYETVKKKFKGKKFYESESFEKASLTDFIQYLIDKGHKISTMNTNSGWMEIHNFENYKKACSIFK